MIETSIPVSVSLLLLAGVVVLVILAVRRILPALPTFAAAIATGAIPLFSWLVDWSYVDGYGGLSGPPGGYNFGRLMFTAFLMLLYFIIAIGLLQWWVSRS